MAQRLPVRTFLVTATVVIGLLAASGPAVAQAVEDRVGVVDVFPSNALTVRDRAQLTGVRVNLPMPDCTERPSDCDEIRLLNQLDGFDLVPRIRVTFDGPIDLTAVTHESLHLRALVGDGGPIGLVRLVVDPATNTLTGEPAEQLREGTPYALVVSGELSDPPEVSIFTTMSATRQLLQMRDQLDDGSAYTRAGIAPTERGIDFNIGGTLAIFSPERIRTITRLDDRGPGDLVAVPVANTAFSGAGTYAFGSFRSPSWLTSERVIPATPTRRDTPAVSGDERVGVVVILPAGEAPAGGWPVAVFGHGFGGTKYSAFGAADFNAARGFATVAIDVVGHGFGPRSEISLELAEPAATVRLPTFGRGIDIDANGRIDSTEGVSAPGQPHPLASLGNRDGLRQTTADLMAVVRAISRGVDVDGDGVVDLRREAVSYYGQSFGGIYGTLLGGVDPLVPVLAPNVPGGPTTEIARLSPVFRPRLTQAFGARRPALLNGGRNGFTESLPLRSEPPVTEPAPGAVAIQDSFARTFWLTRPGNPEAYAPLLRLRPPPGNGAKRILFQVALGDQTVPNPTSANILRAGQLFDVTALYRNDRTPYAGLNPHGFLTDARFVPVRSQAQLQILDFFASAGAVVNDPDGRGRVWEVPIADPAILERLNFTLPPG